MSSSLLTCQKRKKVERIQVASVLAFAVLITSRRGSRELTLKPMSPFLQQRQASMRKMKVKSPEKEMATTAREEGHDSSLRGAPSAMSEHICVTKAGIGWQTAESYRK